MLLTFLFQIAFAADCPSKPDGYIQLPSDPQSGNKYYSCSEQFTSLEKFYLTNCLLKIYYSTFTRTMAYQSLGNGVYKNLGAIHILINNQIDSTLTDAIDIQFNTFKSCIGCAIMIESSESTINFNIYNCTFDDCQSMGSTAVIDYKAPNGNIEKCYFLNGFTTSSTSGYINLEQPAVTNNDFILTITGNVFEHKKTTTSYSFLVISNNNCKFDFNNNKVIFNEGQTDMYAITYPDTVTNFDGWSLSNNCIEPFNVNFITKTNNDKIINSFSAECKGEEEEIIPCPPEPFPGSEKYNNQCHLTDTDGTLSYSIKDSLIAFFYCTFTSMNTDEYGKGGAIFISISNEFGSDKELPFKIYNCSFEKCNSIEGGAIYIESIESSRLYEIIDCKFITNKCNKGLSDDTYGGAICIRAKLSNFEISKCSFESNEAGDGGAIYYNTDAVDVSSKIISEETKEDKYALKVTDCKFTQNTGMANGAAIYVFVTNGEPSNPIEVNNCEFISNKAEENEWDDIEGGEQPENGGAIYFGFDSLTSNEAKFAFHVYDCKFQLNTASSKGGAIYITITKTEPLNPIEIKRCDFEKNMAYSSTGVLGFGSDICYTFDAPKSSSLKLSSKKLLESNHALQIHDCNFSNSVSQHRGGSLYISVSNMETSRSFEINGCLFKDITSDIGGAVDIQSTNPKVLFHLIDCDFQKESSLFFNAITGHVEKCRFDDIKNRTPIHYECNVTDATNEDQSFTVDGCNFTQNAEIDSLVFFVPKVSSRFIFTHNEVNIPNNKTFVFNCNEDAKLDGTWKFEENKLNPDNELLINSENALKVQLKASCRNGFLCTPQSPEPKPGYECEKNKHCFVNGDEQDSISYIDISNSNFDGLKDEENKGGSAIHLINYGVVCNNTKFTGCTSEKAAGGGVYIHVTQKINNPISFYDVTFSKCRAVYGGAVYIYSSEENDIDFTLCNFIENKANKKSESIGENLYGGAALYLHVVSSNVNRCTFTRNIGNSIKIVNDFENKNSLKLIKELESSISISDCLFEIDSKSTSSIFYVRGKSNEIQVDVKDCTFKGELAKNTYHIDGVSLAKNEKNSKLRIEFCRFSNDIKHALNSNSMHYSLDAASQKFNFKETAKTKSLLKNNWVLISGLFVLTITSIMIISLTVFAIKKYISQNEQNNENTNEMI